MLKVIWRFVRYLCTVFRGVILSFTSTLFTVMEYWILVICAPCAPCALRVVRRIELTKNICVRFPQPNLTIIIFIISRSRKTLYGAQFTNILSYALFVGFMNNINNWNEKDLKVKVDALTWPRPSCLWWVSESWMGVVLGWVVSSSPMCLHGVRGWVTSDLWVVAGCGVETRGHPRSQQHWRTTTRRGRALALEWTPKRKSDA